MTLIPTDPVLDYFQYLHQLALAQADEIQPAMARIMERRPIGTPTDEDTKRVFEIDLDLRWRVDVILVGGVARIGGCLGRGHPATRPGRRPLECLT